MEKLGALATRLGVPRSAMALAWVTAQKGIAAAIFGATRPEQVVQNAAAADLKLDASVLAEIDAIWPKSAHQGA